MFSWQGIPGGFDLVMCLSQNNMSISKTMKVTLITLARFLVLMQAKIYHIHLQHRPNSLTPGAGKEWRGRCRRDRKVALRAEEVGSSKPGNTANCLAPCFTGGRGHSGSLWGSSLRRIRVGHAGWHDSEKQRAGVCSTRIWFFFFFFIIVAISCLKRKANIYRAAPPQKFV